MLSTTSPRSKVNKCIPTEYFSDLELQNNFRPTSHHRSVVPDSTSVPAIVRHIVSAHQQTNCLTARGILPSLGLDPSLVLGLVVLEEVVGLGLGGTVGVGIVEEVLNAEEHLLDGDGGTPSLLLVEDGEANGPGRVHVGMEEGRDELALGRLGRVLLGELEGDLVHAAGPVGVLLPGDAGLPLHEVGRSIALGFRPGVEAEGMIPAPVFALLR